MRLENEKYSEGRMNISGGEPSGGWTFWRVNRPGGEHSGGWNVLGWNRGRGESSGRWIIRRGENNFYKGVNRPGVNHKRGETSGIPIKQWLEGLGKTENPIQKRQPAAHENHRVLWKLLKLFMILKLFKRSWNVLPIMKNGL